jgi:hypothetical protein
MKSALVAGGETDHNSGDAFLELETPGTGGSAGGFDGELGQGVFAGIGNMLVVRLPGLFVLTQGRNVVKNDVFVLAVTVPVDGVAIV